MIDYLLLIATVLAGGVTAMYVYRSGKAMDFITAFSGAYLFAVIVFHLLPEIYEETARGHFSAKTAGAFLLAGLLFQLILEYFSHGIEHGHLHHGPDKALSAGAAIGLFLHAFSEGLPVHQLHSHAYLYGLLVHKFPIAWILTLFLIGSGMKKWRIWTALVLFSLMTPLGAWVGEHWDFLREHHVYVTAFAAGILTHIGTVIIFESDMHHRLPPRKLAAIILGFLLAYFTV